MSLSSTALVDLIQAKNYLRVNAAASLHISAEFVGVGVDTTVEFTLDHIPIEGSLKLYVNNVLQVENTNFAISGLTITFVVAPTVGHGITANYDYAAGDDTFESYDDDMLETLIEAATKKAEDCTGRYFVQREVVETRYGNGVQMMKLYRQPITEITTVTIDGTEVTDYEEKLSIGRLWREGTWPEGYEIVITYTAGYGVDRPATQALVPDAVAAVLLILSDLFENRGDTIDSINISGIGSTSYKLPSRAEELLNPLRVNLI